ncbi:hypothetical protein K439DRAFT_1626819 [Ramaria rubella]|nr:hypothetical protein K439DRAFT_1626819 [Ramaria rubella]
MQVRYTRERTLDLNDPIDVLRFFFFLRMLRRRFVDDMAREYAAHDPSAAVRSLQTLRWRMKDRPQTPSKRSCTGGDDSEPQAHEPRGSSQQDHKDEVGIEDFTRQELEEWSETREGYQHEAAIARAQLGGKPNSFDVIKALLPEVP